METLSQSRQARAGAMVPALLPLERWSEWVPHLLAPGDAEVLAENTMTAFAWLNPSRIEFVRHADAVGLAQKQWVGMDCLLHEHFSRRLDTSLSGDSALLRCSIMGLYQGAHTQALWDTLVFAPALITLKSTLSECVRLLLFYGTCFKNTDREADYREIESVLMLYENGFMPAGLCAKRTLYVVTG
jgi:hypothetical protein